MRDFMKKICLLVFVSLVFCGCSIKLKPPCLGKTSLSLVSVRFGEAKDAEITLATEVGTCRSLLTVSSEKDVLEGTCVVPEKELKVQFRLTKTRLSVTAERFLESVDLEFKPSATEGVTLRFQRTFLKQLTYLSETYDLCYLNQGGYFMKEV